MKILFLTDKYNMLNSNKIIEYLEENENIEIMCEKIDKDIAKKFEFIISFGYRYIIKKPILDLFTNNIINLHISYLPYNRGADPNLWSILNNTPCGVTIHLIDKGLDTGKILSQKKVQFDYEIDTMRSSYNKLKEAMAILFIDNWNKIKNNEILPIKQDESKSSIHYLKDRPNFSVMMPLGWDTKIADVKKLFNQKTK